jgi:Glu-tRNA(Gln) amidotransferase subunit E-like FAD-binding protein
MYPDTDMPPKAIGDERISRIAAGLASKPWDREQAFVKQGLAAPAARALAVSPRGALAERVLSQLELDPQLVATTLLEELKHAARLTGRTASITDDDLFRMFRWLADKQLFPEARRALLPLLAETAAGGERDGALDRTLRSLGLHPEQPLPDLETEVDAALSLTEGIAFASPAKRHRHTMGLLMSRVGGRISGGEAAELLSAKLGC